MKQLLTVALVTLAVAASPAFADTRDKRVEVPVGGMSCEGCAGGVKRAVANIEGVRDIDVDVAERRAMVTFDPRQTSRRAIEATITELGYVIGKNDPPVRYPEGADVEVLSEKGEDVVVSKHLAPGKVTVVDFHADWCKPCKALDRRLARMTREHEDDLAVRKVNIVDWESPVSRRYMKKVPSLPYVRIYDARGKLVSALHGDQVQKLERHLRRAWNRQ